MTGESRNTRSPGSAAPGAWDRWWPRATATLQFLLGAGTFAHEVAAPQARDALLFWSVALMTGSPAVSAAISMLGDRIGGPRPPGGSSPRPQAPS